MKIFCPYWVRFGISSILWLTASGWSSFSAMAQDLDSSISPAWQATDLGVVGLAGRHAQIGNQLEIYGSGADIWGSADAGYFVYMPIEGDVEMIAQVMEVEHSHPWAKAGIMIRATLSQLSPQVMLAATPRQGVTLIRRYQIG
jgi:hypothetical protein